MSDFKTLDQMDLAGKRVLLRADFNVPMKDGRVSDPSRIRYVVPTIRELLDKGAAIIIASHLGRPKGEVKTEMSLRPLVSALADEIGRDVDFADDCVGRSATAASKTIQPGEVVLLENLRFEPGEEANDPGFAKKLAALADVYVDDAFSCAHRAHASIDGVARLLPAAAGRLLQKELNALMSALENPERPLVAVVGGNKISTKLGVLENLINKVDHLVVGGAMANTFLFSQGIDIGKSLCEADMATTARDVVEAAAKAGCTVVLPIDAVVAGKLAAGTATRTVSVKDIPSDQMMLDVGPETVLNLTALLENCRTLVWNGPLGAFEFPPFDAGTNRVAKKAAELTAAGHLLSVAGGGDTMGALANAGVSNDFTYISSAGGAFLEWLEGRDLPGIEALKG